MDKCKCTKCSRVTMFSDDTRNTDLATDLLFAAIMVFWPIVCVLWVS